MNDLTLCVTEAVKRQVTLHHPDSPELAFLYGTIVTDGNDAFSDQPTSNVCVFADREVKYTLHLLRLFPLGGVSGPNY